MLFWELSVFVEDNPEKEKRKKKTTSLLFKTIVHLMEIFHDFVFVAADSVLCIAIKNFQAFYFCEKKE